jgi:protein N-terminal methyltransferase
MAPTIKKKIENHTDADESSSSSSASAIATDARIDADTSRRYWQGIDASDNGMLGGYGRVSRVDLRGSRSFLAKLGFGRTKGVKAIGRVLEGGAGYVFCVCVSVCVCVCVCLVIFG